MVSTDHAPLLNVAYWPKPSWTPSEGQQLKSLLLFFDGIAVLTTDPHRNDVFEEDPVVAQPLAECGLLRLLEAETLLGAEYLKDFQSFTRAVFDNMWSILGRRSKRRRAI
jgi:hypothetical protein